MLLFDAGNSRCKWAWIENGVWLRQGVLNNNDSEAWQALKQSFTQLNAPHKILVSNVAGDLIMQRLRTLCAAWTSPLELVVAQTEQCGVRNNYEQAAQLGSDRWLALIAAWQRVGKACLVVNCGTATTLDALSASGEFLGGLIMPGMELMRRSLFNTTALPGREIFDMQQHGELQDFPRNTHDAITSGVMRASIAAIQYQYNLMQGLGETHCIVSGGAANIIIPHFEFPVERVDQLVLQGMQIIGQYCSTIKGAVAR